MLQSLPTALFALLLPLVAADVTIIPAPVAVPRLYNTTSKPASSAKDLLIGSAGRQQYGKTLEINNGTRLISSSHNGLTAADNIYPSTDGFLRGALEAWATHQHLVIRPDDVWFAMLTQLNFWMGKHANDTGVRDKFISFEGKEMIHLKGPHLETLLETFQYEIQKRVKTDWLLDWIQPKFSTSTPTDGMVANVLMMGLMKNYFNYGISVICGIPSITLKGEKTDWERLAGKLARFNEFGAEPTKYATTLRPILDRFVKTFDAPTSEDTRTFWASIVTAWAPRPLCGTAPFMVSGWLAAFQFWDEEGHPYRAIKLEAKDQATLNLVSLGANFSYEIRPINGLIAGYSTVPIGIQLADEPELIPSELIVGALGKKLTPGKPAGYDQAMAAADAKYSESTIVADESHGTLEPVPAWFLYREPTGADQNSRGMTGQVELLSTLDANGDGSQCPIRRQIRGGSKISHQAPPGTVYGDDPADFEE